MITVLLLLSAILIILLGLATYFSGSQKSANKIFLLMSLAGAWWQIVNALSITGLISDTNKLFIVQQITPASLIVMLLLYFFVCEFPVKVPVLVMTKIGLGLCVAAVASLFWTDLNISYQPDNPAGPFVLGALYPYYTLVLILLLILSIGTFIRSMTKSRGRVRQQASYILMGIIGSAVPSIVLGAVLPSFGVSSLENLAPLFALIFFIFASLSVVKHRLFDIRIIVARSITYILSLGILLAGFTIITTFILSKLTDTSEAATIAGNASLLLLAVVLFPTLKRFFDRLTNRLFYRDAYDPQSFLDELNSTLVGNIEIGILLRHTTAVIEQNIKADCNIYVSKTEMTPARLMGTTKMELKPRTIELIKEELIKLSQKTVVSDELKEHYIDLRKALENNKIAMISSLVTSYAANKSATAYLILGPKKSGNAYSKQDLRIINIISDELLIAIQNALRFEEIQEFNTTLQEKVNDATSKLQRTNEKLKELDETKDEFISMASHQLRTPLTSVKGYLSMVLDGDAGKVTKSQQQLLNQAYVSSQRMVYLIADLLNVSRLKTGKFVIDVSPTNLADMVEGEIAQLTEVAKARKLHLTFKKPDHFPELMLDETKTRQVVMNFVDNAIYYTPAGGTIKIELKTDRSNVYFMVKDNGLGVPKTEQAHLFTKFYRAKNAQKARPDGTGLGLFMAKKVIAEQGGTILFESIENKGSTFGFKFDHPAAKNR